MDRPPATSFTIAVEPNVPRRLARLDELANNLWYSWDRQTRRLFSLLHRGLWEATGNSPKAFLKRVDEQRLIEAAADPVFVANFNRALSAYDSYHDEPSRQNGAEWLRQTDKVAYFCAEYGFHESFPIYSGGLGILAGDHCKAASDARMPFVAVGLLYRQGYFSQTIDGEGNQHATYGDSDYDDMPIVPLTGADGAEVMVEVEFPGRSVRLKVWSARCGHVTLYLLDSDVESNTAADRAICRRLYGGDRTTRIEQEIVLGIGGVRALRALDIAPTVWHINEGHAAFLVLERMRELTVSGLSFDTALEAVAVNTVFTTHTPVPAGHDHFSDAMIGTYFQHFAGQLKLDHAQLMGLGHGMGNGDFNMTALAIRGSRFQNGVSKIHGGVSAEICRELWPELKPEENPIDYVTNGVHVPTFLAEQWTELFERYLGPDWFARQRDAEFWKRIDDVPDHLFWSVHQTLKSRMLDLVGYVTRVQHLRNSGSEAHLDRLLKYADPTDPNVLTIGFARRFATYKRATMMFNDLDFLRDLITDAKRPVLFVYAGKAHPADIPGQDLIRRLHEISRTPGFEGRLLLLEGYDLRLARRIVSGVDVWLNNPVYPLEASGTSGMKAGINGVLNLSVLDGWWGEGYDGSNGWGIKPAALHLDDARRTREECQTLYELLQDQVIPMYYERGASGFSPRWVRMARRSIATLLPRFNSGRMVGEYLQKFYHPASLQWRRFSEGGFVRAGELAQWKARVRPAWAGVTARRLDQPKKSLRFGEGVQIEVAVQLNGLTPDDVVVELTLARQTQYEKLKQPQRLAFESTGLRTDQGEHRFALDLTPELCGRLEYRIRVYPHPALLTPPFELGMMIWL
ncbi:MAG: alpha-glucan family phosphorylase [Proteobacteria bacterium]|nr:alpha-glucan family phosphorylase [Burkholderiales bacterium]